MEKLTLKKLKGLKGLTTTTDSNCNGYKGKWEHCFALVSILEKCLAKQASQKEFKVDCYTSQGSYFNTVTFNIADVYRYCHINFLGVHDSIADFIAFLECELNKEA